MSMSSPPPFSSEPAQSRRSVASYSTYAEAQAAVDRLSDDRFPVERLAIVGSGLKIVEQVVGRLNIARAAAMGALSGAMTGLLFGLLLGILLVDDDFSPWAAVLWAVLLGAIIGAAFGALSHLMTGGRRDFASVSGLQADRYDVLADEEVAEDARTRLAQMAPPPLSPPPRPF